MPRRPSLERLSAGRVAGMYLAGEIAAINVPDKHGAFVMGYMRHLMERELQRKIDALRAVTTCECGIKWERPGMCNRCT